MEYMNLITLIWWENVDAFWARESRIVATTRREGAKIGELESILELSLLYYQWILFHWKLKYEFHSDMHVATFIDNDKF